MELRAAHVVDGVPRDVTGHQVRRELDSAELAAKGSRQRQDHQGLAQPGHPFQQHVTSGEEARQHVVDRVVLADHGLLHLLAERVGLLRRLLDAHVFCQILWS